MAGHRRSLFLLKGLFAVCRLDKKASVPDWAVSKHFFSVTRTDDELSVVCPQEGIPEGVDCEPGWRCLKIESPFEFDLSGAISSVAALLAEADVLMFMIATQDSDYLMIKEYDLERTISVVAQAGYQVNREHQEKRGYEL